MADADEPGRAAAAEIAAHLHGLGVEDLRVALPEAQEADPESGQVAIEAGSDVADWIPAGICPAVMARFLKPYDPAEAEAEEAESKLDLGLLAENDHYRVLGTSGELVAVWPRKLGRILRRPRTQCCEVPTQIAFAPLAWWRSQVEGEDISRALARQLGDALIRIADGLGPVDESLIYQPGPVRTKTGERIWNLGDRLRFEDGTETGLDGAPGIWTSGLRVELGEPATIQERGRLREAVEAYNWQSPADGQRVMSWIVTSLVGGMLSWRPHVLLIGPTDSGKSWFLENVIEPIVGRPLGVHMADATVADMYRIVRRRTLPIVVDEAEGKWVQKLLPIARLASGGERVLEDDERVVRPNGRAATLQGQYLRFSLLLSVRAMPQLEPADANRFALSQLEGKSTPAVRAAIKEALGDAKRFRSALIRESWEIAAQVAELQADMEAHPEYGVRDRAILNAAALTAGWTWWGGEALVQPTWAASEAPGADVVQQLLALPIRFQGQDMTVVQALSIQGYGDEVAKRLGIRRDEAGTGLMVACTHSGLLAALDRTSLTKKDLRKVLLRIPGSESRPNPQSFGGRKQRFRPVVVPVEILEALGIELPSAR